MIRLITFVLLLVAIHFPHSARTDDSTKGASHKDLLITRVGETELRLNLYLPPDAESPPLVVFIHGGGWRKGSYQMNRVPFLPEHGFALATVGYRLSSVETFPAQIHDVKAAIRWLRAHADTYGYDASRIGVCGTSAGGHLAMLLGMTNGLEPHEGTVGEHPDEDSSVQAIVNYFGPSDFVLRSKTQPAKTEEPTGSAYLLLGGKASEQIPKAKLASPAWQVTEDDPPLLILHGKADKTVYVDQAERIRDAYETTGLEVDYHLLEGAGHGGSEFFTGENDDRVVRFFRKHLSKP